MRRLIERCRPLYSERSFRILFVLNVLLGFAYSFVLPFMSMFGTIEVGMTKMRFGVFMTLTTAAGVLIGTVLARYSDTHLSRRFVLLWGSISGVAGYVGYAYCRSFIPLLLIGTVVLGLSTTTFSQLFAHARELLAASDIAPAQRVFYMNAFRMFFALSWTIGPMLAAWIMMHYSYRGLFLAAAANFALFAWMVARSVPDAPPLFALEASRSSRSLRNILSRADLLAHLAAMGLICAATTMSMVNLPLLILETLHGTQVSVGITYSVAPVFEVPFMLYFGWLATRRESVGIVRTGLVIAAIYFVALLLVVHPWQVYFCQILSAAMTAVISGVAITYFQSHLPHHPGTATNLYSNAMRVGSTGGYFLFGPIAEHLGYRGVFGFCAGFAVLALGLMFVPARNFEDEPPSLVNPRPELNLVR
jgi:SET family sugar efflux transporter-like MFS transporter